VSEPIVTMRGVTKTFETRGGTVHAVNGVDLDIGPGETLALIGESGSGKSTLGRLLLGLHTPDSGSIGFEGIDLASLDPAEVRRVRRRLTVVFQEPDESLNPRMTILQNVAEPLRIHQPELTRRDIRDRVVAALDSVSLPAEVADRYPRQLSGGQQQRVGIARAIVTEPRFVVLDEPTSSLDLSVRSQILTLLRRLQERLGLSYLLITHDIHTVRYASERLAVMYLGQIVESGPTQDVFADPRHPYTRALLSSTLSPDPRERLETLRLTGEVPKPTDLPKGCLFRPRCPFQDDERCATERPPLVEVRPGHRVATFYELPPATGSSARA
jgi:peptide/nickel transport system ATP-binding protein/oligopeptide transport system ATP-binding protein